MKQKDCLSLAHHCYALLTEGWLKLDRNKVMWLLHLCLVCASLLPGSAIGSSLLLWASGFVIYWLKTAWDLYLHLAVGARKSSQLGSFLWVQCWFPALRNLEVIPVCQTSPTVVLHSHMHQCIIFVMCPYLV